jgi:hypothetical protein
MQARRRVNGITTFTSLPLHVYLFFLWAQHITCSHYVEQSESSELLSILHVSVICLASKYQQYARYTSFSLRTNMLCASSTFELIQFLKFSAVSGGLELFSVIPRELQIPECDQPWVVLCSEWDASWVGRGVATCLLPVREEGLQSHA